MSTRKGDDGFDASIGMRMMKKEWVKVEKLS
jgi:hypothetical protein